MPKALASTFATVYGSVATDLTRRLGDAQAAQMGAPVAEDIEPAGDAERVRAWNARNPEATDEAMLRLAQQKLAEHAQSGLPIDKAIAATAEDLTHFRYGQRLKLYTYGQPTLSDQVKEAERISRLARRESTPDPEPPPPTMPTAGLTNAATSAAPAASVMPGTAPSPEPLLAQQQATRPPPPPPLPPDAAPPAAAPARGY